MTWALGTAILLVGFAAGWIAHGLTFNNRREIRRHPCDPGRMPKVCDRCGKKKPLGNRAGSPQWICADCDKTLSS